MKQPLTMILTGLLLVVSAAGARAEGREVAFTGTVQYQDLEGGFWGIVSDTGKKYVPINLSPSYHKQGFRVTVKAQLRADMISIHMWGSLIQIAEIEALASPITPADLKRQEELVVQRTAELRERLAQMRAQEANLEAMLAKLEAELAAVREQLRRVRDMRTEMQDRLKELEAIGGP